jgi:hypothetical protein
MENMSELKREKQNQADDDDRAERTGSDTQTRGAGVENCGDEYRELPGDADTSLGNTDATLAGDSTKLGKP